MRILPFCMAALLLIADGFRPIAAQTDRASLEGTVTDPAGATVSGAKVKVTAVATAQSQERTQTSMALIVFRESLSDSMRSKRRIMDSRPTSSSMWSYR